MKGKPGTSVKLTIVHDGEEPKVMTLKRAIIKVKSIKFSEKSDAAAMDDDKLPKIGYLRVSDFGATTTKELKDALKDLEKKNGSGSNHHRRRIGKSAGYCGRRRCHR